MIRERTGLVIDAYFSGTKLRWILDNVDGARQKAERGELAFGTVDSWLIYRLTGGAVHVTDATNASRTMLYNLRDRSWDADLLREFDVPESVLPDDPALQRRRRDDREVAARRGSADCGHGRRPAGVALRAGLLQAGDGQEHLRHRLVRPHAHRRPARAVAEHAGDGRLATRRQRQLRAGGKHLRYRSGHRLAARRPGHHRPGDGSGVAGRGRRLQRRRLLRAGVRRSGCAVLGPVRARRPSSA